MKINPSTTASPTSDILFEKISTLPAQGHGGSGSVALPSIVIEVFMHSNTIHLATHLEGSRRSILHNGNNFHRRPPAHP